MNIFHAPITDTENVNRILEFCHIDYDAKAGEWSKDNSITLPNIKINLFMDGEFSVFSGGKNHRPVYGDICVLPPFQTHYGQIPHPTHNNYYQLDIGTDTFDCLPDGDKLLNKLCVLAKKAEFFIRPNENDVKLTLKLSDDIEKAILKNDRTLAYIKSAELVSNLCRIYENGNKVSALNVSLLTQNAIKIIERDFGGDLSVYSLAKRLKVSPSYLSRTFKKDTGLSLHEYVLNCRVNNATRLLENHSVTETGYICGFCDSSHFISVFKKVTGQTPRHYTQKNFHA